MGKSGFQLGIFSVYLHRQKRSWVRSKSAAFFYINITITYYTRFEAT